MTMKEFFDPIWRIGYLAGWFAGSALVGAIKGSVRKELIKDLASPATWISVLVARFLFLKFVAGK